MSLRRQGFTGQRLDATGLYYYNARYYDATIGRFISPDTVIQNPANPQTLNRYSYCVNNPLNRTDPTGHDQIITTGGVNDNGETWYTICDGQGNLLAIATGIDDLAQKMKDCESVSRDVDLPLGQGAKDFFAKRDANVLTYGDVEQLVGVFIEAAALTVEIPLAIVGTVLIATGVGSPAGIIIDVFDGLFTVGTGWLSIWLYKDGQKWNDEHKKK